MEKGQTEKKQPSYKSCFTAIFAVFFFPLFVFWLTWKNTKLKHGLKITTLIIMGIFDVFLYGILIWAIIASTGAPSLADMKSPTNQKSLTVSGSNSYNNSDIKVYLNNEVAKELKADGKGDFSTTLELKEGSNKIKASATSDKNKTKTGSEAEVIYDITPPDFSFGQPQSPTSSDKFTLKGKSEKNAQIVIYSADKEVKKMKVKKDTFEIKDIALNEGENKFTVKAIDEADNYSQPKELTVVYNKPKEEAKKSETPSQTPTPKPATPTPTPKPATPTPPPAQTTQPEKTVVDKLWEALDASIKTRDGYSISFWEGGKATLTRSPQDYWDETATVKGAYATLVSFGLKAFQIDGVNRVEVLLRGNFTDQYGKSSEEDSVDIIMKKDEFNKYDWENLIGTNVYNQMTSSSDYYYVHPAIFRGQKIDKLTLSSF